MLTALLLLIFFGLGVKVVLAAAVLYMLLPDGGRCACCDGETVAVQRGAVARGVQRALRVETRWCPHCGDSFSARRGREARLWVGTPEPDSAGGVPRVRAGNR